MGFLANITFIKVQFIILLLLILIHRFINGPEIDGNLIAWLGMGTFWWFIESLLLIACVRPLVKGSVYGLSLFCFVLLIYFCFYVMAAWTPEPVNLIFGVIKSLLVASLFISAMFYIKPFKAQAKARAKQMEEQQ